MQIYKQTVNMVLYAMQWFSVRAALAFEEHVSKIDGVMHVEREGRTVRFYMFSDTEGDKIALDFERQALSEEEQRIRAMAEGAPAVPTIIKKG